MNVKGQEISGYIDYSHRLKTEDFEQYFSEKKKLLPKPSDLSFYNWENQMITSNNTPNYQVIAESIKGILFKNKRDRKIINVDPHVIFVSGGIQNKKYINKYVFFSSLHQATTRPDMKSSRMPIRSWLFMII